MKNYLLSFEAFGLITDRETESQINNVLFLKNSFTACHLAPSTGRQRNCISIYSVWAAAEIMCVSAGNKEWMTTEGRYQKQLSSSHPEHVNLRPNSPPRLHFYWRLNCRLDYVRWESIFPVQEAWQSLALSGYTKLRTLPCSSECVVCFTPLVLSNWNT